MAQPFRAAKDVAQPFRAAIGIPIAAPLVMFSRRVGRLPGFSYLGPYRYFLTFCTNQRRQVFTEATLVDRCVQQFVRAGAARNFELSAYCVMPDHVHLLVEGTAENSHLPAFASLAKQFSGFACRRYLDQRLWQDGYYDHVLRDAETSAVVARYLLENPVRAGLTAHLSEYPFIGSSRFTRTQLIEWAYDSQP